MTNENHITGLKIAGFKSIKEMQLELNNLNIIVGANGSGKSNLLSFFKLFRAFIDGDLNRFIKNYGGARDILFNGKKATEAMLFDIRFFKWHFRFSLLPTTKDEFTNLFDGCFSSDIKDRMWDYFICQNKDVWGDDLLMKGTNDGYDISKHQISKTIASWQVYHFHDTNKTAGMRYPEIIQDDQNLREDAANIAPFLLRIKKESPDNYAKIVDAVRSVAPFFDDFFLEPRKWGLAEKVHLRWKQKGSDYSLQPYHFSDGTMRFICLAVAFLQPKPPAILIIDEPELGLHPFAISILAELIQAASEETQIIIATQSTLLIDHFAVEDIIVARGEDGASTFTRMKEEDFSPWLEEYSLGELLTKNVIRGGPVYE